MEPQCPFSYYYNRRVIPQKLYQLRSKDKQDYDPNYNYAFCHHHCKTVALPDPGIALCPIVIGRHRLEPLPHSQSKGEGEECKPGHNAHGSYRRIAKQSALGIENHSSKAVEPLPEQAWKTCGSNISHNQWRSLECPFYGKLGFCLTPPEH